MSDKGILFAHLLNDRSGSPRVLCSVIKALANENSILVTSKSTNGFLNELDIEKKNIFYKRFSNKFLTIISYLISQLIIFFRILFTIDLKNIDTVYVNTVLPFGAALAGAIKGKKIIYHIHEISIKPIFFRKTLLKICSLVSAKNIYVSNDLKERLGINSKSYSVIYNCLDESLVSNEKSSYKKKYDPSNFSITMLCSLKDYKGIPEFIKLSRDRQMEKIKFNLVINDSKKNIDSYMSKYSLSKNFLIMSSPKDLKKIYQESSVVVNLSRPNEWVETFGLTLIEGMSFGCPVIAPSVGGPTEIVINGWNGYMVNSCNINEIKNKIIEMFSSEDKYNFLSQNAFITSRKYTFRVFQENIIRVLSE